MGSQSEIGKIQENVEKWVDAYKWRQRVRVASKDINLKDKEVHQQPCIIYAYATDPFACFHL